MVERSAVNRKAVGSSPTLGATLRQILLDVWLGSSYNSSVGSNTFYGVKK